MVQLLIPIPDECMGGLALAAAAQEKSINDYVAGLISQAVGASSLLADPADQAIEEALRNIAVLKAGDVFELTEVISTESWELLSNGQKKSLGKRFKKITEQTDTICTFVETKTNRHSTYRRL